MPTAFENVFFSPEELLSIRKWFILKEAYVGLALNNNYGRRGEQKLEIESWSSLISIMNKTPLNPAEQKFLDVANKALVWRQNQ